MQSVLADQQRVKTGRPRAWTAGLLLSVLVVVTLLVIVRGHDSAAEVERPDVRRASPAEAATALRSWSAAVRARDASALRALATPGDSEAAERLAATADNARLLDLNHVTASFVSQASTVAADGSWVGMAEVTWQMSDVDPSPAQAEVVVSFTTQQGRLAITDIGSRRVGTRGRTPLWLSGPLSVVSTTRSLVLVDGTYHRAEQIARSVQRGSRAVHQVLPGWDRRVVVEVAANSAELNDTLGVPPGTYDSIAAVTASVDGSMRRDGPVHVFLNLDTGTGTAAGETGLVMRHELVHVATQSATSMVEPWLAEGFADFVALRDVALSESTLLAHAVAIARRDGLPTALPGPDQFEARSSDLQGIYEQAWLACLLIAERVGERGLVSVQRAAASGVPVDKALRQVGLEPEDLFEHWQRRLRNSVG